MYSRDHGPIYGGLVTWGIMLTFLLSQLESRDTINLKRWGVKCIMLQCLIISFIIALWPFDPLESEREIAGKRIFFRFSYPFSSTFFYEDAITNPHCEAFHTLFFCSRDEVVMKKKERRNCHKKVLWVSIKIRTIVDF